MTNAQHADNFVGRYNGKYIDEDRQYGSQCWDVVARYAREEYGCPSFPTVSGGAEGLWRYYASPIPKYFDKVPRDALKKGDIAVWSADFYPPYGHTSLVWAREGGNIWSFEQDGSHPTGVAYLAQRTITSKLAGGLRPKGENMQPTPEQVGKVYKAMTGKDISQKDLDFYITAPRTLVDLVYGLLPGVEKTRAEKELLEKFRDEKLYPEIERLKAQLAAGSGDYESVPYPVFKKK